MKLSGAGLTECQIAPEGQTTLGVASVYKSLRSDVLLIGIQHQHTCLSDEAISL